MAAEISESDRVGFADALGRTVKVARTDLGIDRKDLAGLAGISYSYLSAIESGQKHPSPQVLMAIARSIGLRTHQLLELVEGRRDGAFGVFQDRPQATVDPTQELGGAVTLSQDSPEGARDPFIEEMERLSRTMTGPSRRLIIDMARKLAT